MIQFQHGKEFYKEALIEMWKLCFPDDTQDFRNFYFDKVYQNEETLLLLENKTPVAALQMIPYQIKLEDKIYPAAYISGAMTHPVFQGKGYMGKLLNYAFEEMKQKKIPISFLIPQEEWLFDFYSKYGYQKAFPWYSSASFKIKERKIDTGSFHQYKTMEEIDLEDLYAIYFIYSSFLNKKGNVVLKTKQQFSNILEDIFLDNGSIFVGRNEIAMAIPGENKSSIILKECFCETNIKTDFLSAIANLSEKNEIIEINNSSESFSHYWGMIRILDESMEITENIYMNTMLN